MKFPSLQITPDRTEQQVEDGWTVARQKDWSGGSNVDENTIAPNELLAMVGCKINSDGYLSSSSAFENILTGGAASEVWVAEYNGNAFLFLQSTGTLYGTAWDGISQVAFSSLTPLKTGLAATGQISAVQWDNKMCFFPTSTIVPFYVGIGGGLGFIAANIGGSPPFLQGVVVYANAIWGIVVGVDIVNPSTNQIRFSGAGNINSWDALDVINVAPTDGLPLTAIKPSTECLYLCKELLTYVLYGTSRFDFQISSAPIAKVGSFTGGSVSDNLFLLEAGGVYQLSSAGANQVENKNNKFFSLRKWFNYIALQISRVDKVLFLPPFDDDISSANCALLFDTNTRSLCNNSHIEISPLPYPTASNFANMDFGRRTIFQNAVGYAYDFVALGYVGASYGLYGYRYEDTANGHFKIQTAHSDFNAQRDKVFRCFILNVSEAHTSVTVKYYLDRGAAVTFHNGALVAGDNLLFIHDANGNYPRGKTISIEISTTEAPIIREMGIEYCLAGGALG